MPRFVAVALASTLGVALATSPGCQGPDEFFRFNDANETGTAGSSPTGVAGTTGTGNAGGGTGGGPTGLAGANGGAGGSSGGSVGTGTAGSGTGTGGATSTAGTTGAAGSTGGRGGATSAAGTTGAAGSTGGRGGTTGAAGTTANAGSSGTAGSSGGRGGTTGAAGTTANAGSSGTAGSSGGRGGTTGTGGGAGGSGGGAGPRIQVVAQCQAAVSMQEIKVTFKILNPESLAKQWSDIKVRYYFSPSMQLAPMVIFDFVQKWPSNMLTATATTSYVEIGFAAGTGMVNGFDNITGSDQIQLRLANYTTTTWNTSQDDDYSYKSCAGVTNTSAYTDRLTMPGYYQGQIAWGAEPPP